nr:reverse transcriptase domain-containing protein [Tanacetum cinerariifolium]
SSSKLTRDQTSNPTLSTTTTPKGRTRRGSKQKVENYNLEENLPPVATMANNRTMAELLRAPTEGWQFVGKKSLRCVNDYRKQIEVNEQTSAMTTAMTAMLKQFQAIPPPAPVKAVEETCVTCRGAHPYYQCLAADGNTFPEFRDNIQGYVLAAAVNYNQGIVVIVPRVMKAMQNQIDMVKNMLRNEMKTSIQTSLSNQTNEIKNMMASLLQMNTAFTSSSGTLPSNTVANPKSDLKEITTRSGVSYDGPSIPPLVVENAPEATKDTVVPTNNGNTEDVQPQAVPSKSPVLTSEPVNTPDMSFEISFAGALILMPKFASTLKALIGNKEKLSEMAQTPLNEHCSAVLLKKLLEKLDFDADPRVPLILERSFLKTERASIDVFKGELTLRVGKKAITFNMDQTLRYSANYNDMTAKRIDVIDMACEEYSQEVLGFSDTVSSGNPTPFYDPIVFATSPTLTPFRESDFFLEEVDEFLDVEDEPTSSQFPQSYLDLEGDILLLEAFLNDDPSPPPPNQRDCLLEVRKELKICEAKTKKSSVDEPPVVELKALPPHLEYDFLEGDDKLPIIIAKDLSMEEKAALITVLKSHKRAIAWKLSDIKDARKISRESFHDMIKKTMEVFIDDFSVFGDSFQSCLSHLEKMLKSCEDTNLCLNWEKSHFMVKEGIVLGHKISKKGIKVDKAKIVVISKLPHPTTVKGIRNFLGHAGFYRRFIKDFSKIARPMTRILEKDTPFVFSQECVDVFQTLKRILTEAPILIASDWDIPFEIMCDASDFAIGVVRGQRRDKHFWPIHYAK